PDARLGGSEVLLWPGHYAGDAGAALRRAARKAIEKKGFAYKEASADQKVNGNDVYLCSATSTERRVLGMWVASDEGAVLVWAEDRAASQKVADGPVKAVGEAAFGNVVYAAPKG